MKIVCDSCSTKYSISDDKVRGKVFKIRCKKCSHIIVVRGTADAASPAAAAAAPEGVWHLVINGDQVGPLTDADVRTRVARGEVSADSYIWREGFADWQKISSVPEFSDIAGAPAEAETSEPARQAGAADATPAPVVASREPAAPMAAAAGGGSGRSGGMFAGGGSATARPARSAHESDVFASPSPAAARGGADLFAAAAVAPAVESNGAGGWPASSGGGAAFHDGGRVDNLTGQRHENSVLFSLANLQALATASKPSAAPSSSGSASPSSSSEGSGLIDIRAMAATTLSAPSESKSDDLPAFATFAPAAPVLLPMSSSGPPKWVYPALAGMAILVVGIVVMAFKLMSKPTVMAPAPIHIQTTPPPEAPKVAPAPVAAPKPTIAEQDLPPREGAAPEKGATSGASTSKKGGKPVAGKGGSKGSAEPNKAGGGAAEKAPVASPAPEPEKKPAPKSGSLDDLLEGALAGKPRTAAPKAQDDAPVARKKESEPQAAPLTKSQVEAGMAGVKGRVSECYQQYKVAGLAMVNVVISKAGKVTSASVSGKFAGTPTGACVERAVRSASFPPNTGLSTPYPFNLR